MKNERLSSEVLWILFSVCCDIEFHVIFLAPRYLVKLKLDHLKVCWNNKQNFASLYIILTSSWFINFFFDNFLNMNWLFKVLIMGFILLYKSYVKTLKLKNIIIWLINFLNIIDNVINYFGWINSLRSFWIFFLFL